MRLSGIAPTLNNQIAQDVKLIYPARSYQQDTYAHQQGVSSKSLETRR
jgi:hypothetical protein